jgi:hypothetical protein
LLVLPASPQCSLAGESQSLQATLSHLRSGPAREWDDFAEQAGGSELRLRFQTSPNLRPVTLQLRQQDVKQEWRVLLNDVAVGLLQRDENDMRVYWPLPAQTLKAGENELRIVPASRSAESSDDIRVGDIGIIARPLGEVLNESRLQLWVTSAENATGMPCRITIQTMDGALQTTGAGSDDRLAVRPGTVYSLDGRASIGLPAGRYRVLVGRGFEYSLASHEVTLAPGGDQQLHCSLSRQVPTDGYVACDTHIHTLTYSGHGDASLTERLITIAGEGIELPIATDHNVHTDYRMEALRLGAQRFFTPVIGNEVTTKVGHFNIFPIAAGAAPVDVATSEWGPLLDRIEATPDVRIAVLNHARDLHSGVRPFGPALHNSLAGQNIAGWPMRFNAMEIINSSATQSDPLQLCHDWMAVLNRGYSVTPVGSSDSHDVARHFVGQGRTYIRCADGDPGAIDVAAASESIRAGRVLVSYGLLVELTVNGSGRSGDLVSPKTASSKNRSAAGIDRQNASLPRTVDATLVAEPHAAAQAEAGATVDVDIRVLAPEWIQADQVRIYVNGMMTEDIQLPPARPEAGRPGLRWQLRRSVKLPGHDVHLVAVATGPGITGSHWRTARPYQPVTPRHEPRVMACSGAVWIDVDGDGRKSSARAYAVSCLKQSGDDLAGLVRALAAMDESVTVQALYELSERGIAPNSTALVEALESGTPAVKRASRKFTEEWRATELARVK